jgi:hypothetical protein
MNCSDRNTPWNMWVLCKKYVPGGQVYQVDPFGHDQVEMTTIGIRQDGYYEAFPFDDQIKTHAPCVLDD